MVVDINAFESNDKGSTEKYYRKIPKEMLVIAFKKDWIVYLNIDLFKKVLLHIYLSNKTSDKWMKN